MAAEIAEKRAARDLEAPYCPFTATVTSVCILSPVYLSQPPESPIDWHTVYEDSSTAQAEGGGYRLTGAVAYAAMKKISEALKLWPGPRDNQLSVLAGATQICGLRIREKLQLLAADAMRYARQAGIPFNILTETWWHPNFSSPIWCDPYEVVVPSDQRQWVKYEQLAEYLRIPFPCDGVEQDARAQVAFAGEIARAANL